MDFKIKHISPDELESFQSILREAAAWLIDENKAMWNEKQLSIEQLLHNNAMDEMYIGYVNNEAAAAMILQEEDRLLWPDVTNDESLFLHKLAVRRRYAKQGISQKMIIWAKLQAKNRDKAYLRLDCAADRPQLCKFYENQGFHRVGEQLVLGKYPTALYEFHLG